MAAEKKPRAAKATSAKSGTTKKTATAKAKVQGETTTPATPKAVRTRKPKPVAVGATPVTAEMIAERAYYIWVDGSGADAFANWVRAERELTAA